MGSLSECTPQLIVDPEMPGIWMMSPINFSDS
uniref:Uncharacterized protein n=1 Tax=Rhizophora mucronata TaxID=61149 RepID=A0A2P2Q6N0_RHIMU